jgi:hypothetical protein
MQVNMATPRRRSVWHMKLMLIKSRIWVRAQVVPVIRGNENASSRAGSRARTKTAACGAANRGFESHPARQLKLGLSSCENLSFLQNYLLHLDGIFAISIVAMCHSCLGEAILSVKI